MERPNYVGTTAKGHNILLIERVVSTYGNKIMQKYLRLNFCLDL